MSDWKQRANKRRDAQHTKAPDPEPNKSAKPSKKKDTKKWCRGKEGVEHKLKCLPYDTTKHTDSRWGIYSRWKILACTECGKEIDWYCPTSWYKRPKPDWVVD